MTHTQRLTQLQLTEAEEMCQVPSTYTADQLHTLAKKFTSKHYKSDPPMEALPHSGTHPRILGERERER